MSQTILEPLEKALKSLEQALAEPLSGALSDIVRDASIQRFEYCYELTWKTLKHFLRVQYRRDVDIQRDIFRYAQEVGLLDDVSLWLSFAHARNLTVHTYNVIHATEVYAVTKPFLTQALSLVARMKAVQND